MIIDPNIRNNKIDLDQQFVAKSLKNGNQNAKMYKKEQ